MNNNQEIISAEELLDILGKKSNVSSIDIFSIIKTYLDRKNIDLITRIDRTELDKICITIHSGFLITLGMNIEKEKKIKDLYSNNILSNVDNIEFSYLLNYALLNLGLRLSLDGKSREELNNLFVSLIKLNMDLLSKDKEREKNEIQSN